MQKCKDGCRMRARIQSTDHNGEQWVATAVVDVEKRTSPLEYSVAQEDC